MAFVLAIGRAGTIHVPKAIEDVSVFERHVSIDGSGDFLGVDARLRADGETVGRTLGLCRGAEKGSLALTADADTGRNGILRRVYRNRFAFFPKCHIGPAVPAGCHSHVPRRSI